MGKPDTLNATGDKVELSDCRFRLKRAGCPGVVVAEAEVKDRGLFWLLLLPELLEPSLHPKRKRVDVRAQTLKAILIEQLRCMKDIRF